MEDEQRLRYNRNLGIWYRCGSCTTVDGQPANVACIPVYCSVELLKPTRTIRNNGTYDFWCVLIPPYSEKSTNRRRDVSHVAYIFQLTSINAALKIRLRCPMVHVERFVLISLFLPPDQADDPCTTGKYDITTYDLYVPSRALDRVAKYLPKRVRLMAEVWLRVSARVCENRICHYCRSRISRARNLLIDNGPRIYYCTYCREIVFIGRRNDERLDLFRMRRLTNEQRR